MNDDLNLLDLVGEEDTKQPEVNQEESSKEEDMTEEPMDQEETDTEKEQLDAVENSEVQQESEEEEDEEKLDENLVTLADFLTSHADDVENARGVSIKLPNVPDDKYLLFVTEKEEDADVILLSNTDKLAFEDFEPTRIIVEKSGVIAENNDTRTYVSKTNVIQYKVNSDGSPVSVTTFRKISKNDVNPKTEGSGIDSDQDAMSVDEIKLHIASVSSPLEKKVKDLETVEDIRNETLNFMSSVVDVGHLTKLNNMMMKTGM